MKRYLFARGLLALVLLLALGAFAGCGENEQSQSKPATVSKEDVKKQAKEAYDATKTYTQEQMQAFRQQTEAKLAEYEKDIDQLQAKAEKMGGDAKAKAEQQLAALRQKRDAVSEKMKELGSSSEGAWEQIKSGIEVPKAVNTITGTSSPRSRRFRSSCRPSRRGILRSVNTRSKGDSSKQARASSPSAACTTS